MRVQTGSPPRIASAVGRFMLGSLAAIGVIVVGNFLVLRSIATDQAERETRERVQLEARLVEEAALTTDGILTRDPEALRRVDEVVQSHILGESVVRVKIWGRDGTILYSDEPAIIGEKFEFEPEYERLLETGGADAEISDLSKPENRYERQEGKLLEAHTPMRTKNGTQVLFEIYQRFDSINASAARLLRSFAPPLLGGLVVLLLFQIPLAWGMGRRLQRGHQERERLLARAIEASEVERHRIAADLHDGVVQDIAGVAFGLAPLVDSAGPEDKQVLQDSVDCLRQGVRDLRTLLVEIHPPRLENAGLEAALDDLMSPLRSRGVETELHVRGPSGDDPLVYRVAREALRNVQAHAKANSVRVDVTPGRLAVTDDGRGIAAGERERRREEGHLGLALLEDLVSQQGGTLSVQSEAGAGTTVELELPR